MYTMSASVDGMAVGELLKMLSSGAFLQDPHIRHTSVDGNALCFWLDWIV